VLIWLAEKDFFLSSRSIRASCDLIRKWMNA
jgi:hypothetical protein